MTDDVLARIKALVALREVRASLHGFRELAADGILLDDLLDGIEKAVVIEDYFDATRGPTVLVLRQDSRPTCPRGLGYSKRQFRSGRACNGLSA